MRLLLGIFCAIVALFAGGCSLLLLAPSSFTQATDALPFVLLLGGIALLNVLVLIALWGKRKPQRWAFYVLGVLDVIVALVIAVFWISTGVNDREMSIFALTWMGIVLLKGVLSFAVVRRI